MDTASAVAIALMTFGTMYPMSVYSGKVLLQVRASKPSRLRLFSSVTLLLRRQTTPPHVIGQLDKLLREVRRSFDPSFDLSFDPAPPH